MNRSIPTTNDPTNVRARTISTPIGDLSVVAELDFLVAILWPNEVRSILRADPTPANLGDKLLDDAEAQLAEYFRGTRQAFDLPLRPSGTPFQQDAWSALRKIPYGETRSYAYQASAIGKPKAVRAVGAANGRNPLSIVVPCHRVVGSNGSLTGFAGGVDTKRWLLNHERNVVGAPSDSTQARLFEQ